MRYSHLFGKTTKSVPRDEVSQNAQLLIRAGFIYKEMAGVYAYLPLGLRVFEKIKQIVRDEMNSLGCQELTMTSLQPKENWNKTNRWDDEKVDVWFKTNLKNGVEVGLAWSHEEPITLMLRSYIQSYRDLPVNIYQFQNKLRNEVRAKSGIMRTREFVMKDLYSFSRNDDEHQAFYDQVSKAYLRIFEKVGLGDRTYLTFASGGAFTQFSHEFQTVCEAGEDIIYIDHEKKIAVNKEVFTDEVIAQLKLNKDNLEKRKAAEVGNIFSFGTSKCEALNLFFTDQDGQNRPVVLGSYGIGIGRLMGVIVETFADNKGIVWPESVAPYGIHLVGLNLDKPEVKEKIEKIYSLLLERGLEVLYDDREETSAGEKFGDADLIGIPWRLVVSAKTGDQVEIKSRTADETKLVNLEDFFKDMGI